MTDRIHPPLVDVQPLIPHPYTPFFHTTIGCVLLAGGHGSRLNSPLPKGLIPLPHSGKTLFEIFFRRCVGFFHLYKKWPQCIVMTSQENEEATQHYLHANDFFGVPKEYVHFLCQSSLPLLDEAGNPYVEQGVIQTGPDGNGKIFSLLNESGLLQKMKTKGVSALSIALIDNPLMDPFLPSLFHPVLENKKEASFLAIQKRNAEEKTGIFLIKENRLHVLEYSEAPASLKEALDQSGNLLYRWANISTLAASLDTFQKLSQVPVPLHLAQKMKGSKQVLKQEYFLFDVFPAIESFSLIGIDRKRWFSPIKAKEGEDSLESGAKAFIHLQQEQAKQASLFLSEYSLAGELDPSLLYGY